MSKWTTLSSINTLPKLKHYWNLTIRLFSVIPRTLIWGWGLILLQRCSFCILQPQPTGQLTTGDVKTLNSYLKQRWNIILPLFIDKCTWTILPLFPFTHISWTLWIVCCIHSYILLPSHLFYSFFIVHVLNSHLKRTLNITHLSFAELLFKCLVFICSSMGWSFTKFEITRELIISVSGIQFMLRH